MFDIFWSFEALLFLGCLPWYLVAWGIWLSLKHVQSLPAISSDGDRSYPKLSVIIAARNEADTVKNALKSVLAQKYPNLEIILVNDRSTDGTDEILAKLAEKDPRVSIHHVEELPSGWLGKVHAMHQGFFRSTGEWLLFTDADVHFEKGCIDRIIDVAERSSVDYLCVVPEVQARQSLLRALYTVSLSGFFLATRIWEVKNQKAFVGVGACGLVRRSQLAKSPGLSWLKMEVVDDLALAQLIWQTEGKLDVYWGRECVGVEWYPSLGDLIRGLEKNLFAGAQYQYWRALLGIIGILFIAVAPWFSIALEFAGLIFLLWLSISMIKNSFQKVAIDETGSDHLSAPLFEYVRNGFLIVFLNPKIAAFYLAIFSQFLDAASDFEYKILLVVTATVIDGLWYILLTFVIAVPKFIKFFKLSAKKIEFFLGVVLLLVSFVLGINITLTFF